MLEDTNTTAIGDDAPVTPKRTTPPTVKTFVPNFILPLSGGGLFSRKIASKETPAVFGSRFGTKPTAATDTNEVEESSSWAAAPSPTPSPPPTTRISTFVPPKPTRPESSSWTVPAPPVSKAPEFVKIVTSSADVFEVRYRDETYSAEKADAALSKPPAVDPPSKKNYFGVDIHGLLDQYNNEKAKAAAAASATGLSTAATAELEKANQGPAPALPPKKNEMLWSEKYRAKKFTDLVGDERTHRDVLRWLTTWDKIVFPGQQRAAAAKRKPVVPGEFVPPHKKILLLHGPPGLGKTTLAHVAARQAGYEPFEINASDDRSGGVVKGKIKDMLTIEGVKSAGITCGKKKLNLGKPVCLVVDEIDGVTGGATAGSTEGGFVKSLIDLILEDQKTVASAGHNGQKKKGKGKSMDRFRLLRPIIAVCNDAYSPNLKPLRQYAEVVVMRVPPESLLIERLDWVFDQEGYATEDGASRRIVELSSMGNSGRKGDMRAALVNGEWIAARVRQEAIASGGNSTGRIFLTRKAVEDELAGSRFGNSDGKGSSGGRLVMNDVVDSVFHNAKEPQSRCGPRGIKKTTTAQKVQEIVEAIGEYDKIIMGE